MQAQTQKSNSDQLYRMQLIAGLCAAIEEKGYAAATIADIVRHARVSKRTFYEHFADKEACFLAAYLALSEQMMQSIAAAVDLRWPWERRIEAAIGAYFGMLEAQPALARTFLREIHAAGPRALELRREVLDRFADMTRSAVDEARRSQPELRRKLRQLTPAMATALVGGINELALLKVETGRRTRELAEAATALVRAVVGPIDQP